MSVASHIESGDQAIAAALPQSRCRTIPLFDKVMALCSPYCAPQRCALLRKHAHTRVFWAKYAWAREMFARGARERSCVASDC
jgi:hypothetical protein